MKSFILFFIFILSLYYNAEGQMYGGSWMNELFDRINRMNSNLRQNVMSLNQQIPNDTQQQINELTQSVQEANVDGAQTANVTPRSRGSSVSRSVVSGHDADGQIYYHERVNRTEGGILHHTERIYSPSRGTTNESAYTLDLTDPNAKPVIQQN